MNDMMKISISLGMEMEAYNLHFARTENMKRGEMNERKKFSRMF